MLSAGRELAGQIQFERVGAAAPTTGVLVAGGLIGEAGVAQGKPRAGRGRMELEGDLRDVLTGSVLLAPRPGETQLALGTSSLMTPRTVVTVPSGCCMGKTYAPPTRASMVAFGAQILPGPIHWRSAAWSVQALNTCSGG